MLDLFQGLFGQRDDDCPVKPGDLIEWGGKRYTAILRQPSFNGAWLAVERRAEDDAAPFGAPVILVGCQKTHAWQRARHEAEARRSAMIRAQTHHRHAWYEARGAEGHPKDCRADFKWTSSAFPDAETRPFLDLFCPAHREMVTPHYEPSGTVTAKTP